MTLLLGGSVLLIGGSAVTLVLGWLNANETYIWTSIAATVGAAVLLVIAFLRSRKEPPATATTGLAESIIDPEILADREDRATQKYERASTRGSEDDADATAVVEPAGAEDDAAPATDEPEEGESVGTPAPGTVVTSSGLGTAVAAVSASADSGGDADPTAATVGPPAGAADQSGTVVAIPKTKKFHSLGCRFASAKGAESMARADAVERGFQPCGVCKP